MSKDSDDHRTPFMLLTSPGGGMVAQLLYRNDPVPMVKTVSVENIIGEDRVKRSKIIVELYGETEVVRAPHGGELAD